MKVSSGMQQMLVAFQGDKGGQVCGKDVIHAQLVKQDTKGRMTDGREGTGEEQFSRQPAAKTSRSCLQAGIRRRDRRRQT